MASSPSLWQAKVDEVLSLGTNSMKLGEKLASLTEKLQKSSTDAMLDEHYVEAVTTARDFMAGLRKGATRDLEDVLLKKTQKRVEEICLRKSVSETDASNIHVLMKALDLFPASKGVGDLKNKFLKWQRAMACELNKKEVAALGDKIEAELGNDGYDVDLDSFKKVLDSFATQKPVDDMAKEGLQRLAFVIMAKVHNQAGAVETWRTPCNSTP